MKLIIALKAAWKAFIAAWNNPTEKPETTATAPTQTADTSHLRLLTMLQSSGRLVDFLKEDISDYSDAQVGAAVRKIHEECAKSLEDTITIRPVMAENEGTTVKVPPGYDASCIKVVGKIKGEPPYTGVLVHKGWKAHKRSLPKNLSTESSDIICPAEIEVK